MTLHLHCMYQRLEGLVYHHDVILVCCRQEWNYSFNELGDVSVNSGNVYQVYVPLQ